MQTAANAEPAIWRGFYRARAAKIQKNRLKQAISAQIPKKIVEIQAFSLDFARSQAAL